jgi:hypothetical protein
MDQRRSSKRVRTFMEGRIVFNNRFSLIDCFVRDLSEAGARIAFPRPTDIPPEFDLEIPKKNMSIRARVIWSDGKEHGLKFIAPAKAYTGGEALEVSGQPASSTGPPSKSPPDVPSSVENVLNEARLRIAQAVGVPVHAVRLKLEIDL